MDERFLVDGFGPQSATFSGSITTRPLGEPLGATLARLTTITVCQRANARNAYTCRVARWIRGGFSWPSRVETVSVLLIDGVRHLVDERFLVGAFGPRECRLDVAAQRSGQQPAKAQLLGGRFGTAAAQLAVRAQDDGG